MSTAFKESIHSAVNNANLTGALGRFSEAYRVSRAKAYEGIDFEEVRGRIAEVKGYAASHLDELAEIFTKNAEARGAKVFRTKDPQAVNDYILNLARDERREERGEVEVDGVGGDPSQRSIWKRPG